MATPATRQIINALSLLQLHLFPWSASRNGEETRESTSYISYIYLTAKWARSPALPGVSGKAASLCSLECGVELTEKALHCGNEISIWKKWLQLPGKCTERIFLTICFHLRTQNPPERSSKSIIKSYSGVQYKWFSSCSLPFQRQLNGFSHCSMGLSNLYALQVSLNVPE